MVLLIFLGLMDVLTAIFLILFNYGLIGVRPFVTFILYLVLKGVMFKGDVASIIDLVIAAYMILMIFHPIPFFTWIAVIYILQKAAASILLR